ncbi:MAG: TetR/AcrR family transcriptional regulator [Acetatifactor sp.]
MRKEEKTEMTKAKIFSLAIKEFGTNGYAAGTINGICKAGINKGLIYHNFKDKDELYLECVKKSCKELMDFVREHQATEGFVEYMSARREFFREREAEAYIFLEARTHPPYHLRKQIREIFVEFDEMNKEIFEREISHYELRKSVSKEEALNYFLQLQKIYNISFSAGRNEELSPHEQLSLHELNIHKIFNLMLYGIAKGGNEE